MTEESIYLEEVDDLIEKSSISKYPCIVIEGIETESEFVFFRNRTIKEDEKDLCLPMYFECEGSMVEIGQFPLTLDFLLALKNIGDYKVFLCKAQGDKTQIDLNDANTLMKFIKL
jgi:hypothetical protein